MMIEDSVAKVLNSILIPNGQKISDHDEKIFEKGMIDSFGIIEFVVALEKDFGISIPPTEMTVQNFASVRDIARLVEKLKQE